MANHDLPAQFRVKPHAKVSLRKYDPAWKGPKETRRFGTDQLKQEARNFLQQNLARLSAAQELLWATDKYAVLIVLQGMDAAGKDGLIKHVMGGLNPQGCQVFGFKQPSTEELDHDFLWRCNRALPERGRIGIFNRSYYEDVVVVRVHPDLLEKQKLPSSKRGRSLWEARYQDINAFEKHLVRNGTVILKFFLHVSKKEQKRRLLERLDNPTKHWKFSAADIAERTHWHEYMEAYQEAFSATSTNHAPWHIIPADHKWVARMVVSEILTRTIQGLDLKLRPLTKEQAVALAKAKKQLMQE